MQLRPYQLAAVAALRAQWRQRPILVAPCGSGKTVIACEIIRRALERNRLCLFLVHRRELLDQASERLAAFGIEAGQIIAGRKAATSPVQVASIQTLMRRTKPPADVVIVDECSHAASESWKKLIAHYIEHGAAVLGLTATPMRLDGKGLGSAGFGAIVQACTVSDLIADGLLVEPVVFAPPEPDLKGIRTVAGDFAIGALAERMSESKLIGDIVDHWMRQAWQKRTVVFAVNIEHSRLIVDQFRAAGVTAEHIDGSTPKSMRAAVLDRLACGETQVVSNCQVLTEGWDLPQLECAIIARPTKSLALHIQMLGRVVRSCPNKDGAVVLDHAGNAHRLGTITDEIEYSLEDAVRRTPRDSRNCPVCFAVIPLGESSCPECQSNLEPERDTKKPIEHQDGELVKLTSGEHQRQFYAEVVIEADRKGYKLGWARFRFKQQFGRWPRNMQQIEKRNYHCLRHEPERATYGHKVVTRCGRCYAECT